MAGKQYAKRITEIKDHKKGENSLHGYEEYVCSHNAATSSIRWLRIDV